MISTWGWRLGKPTILGNTHVGNKMKNIQILPHGSVKIGYNKRPSRWITGGSWWCNNQRGQPAGFPSTQYTEQKTQRVRNFADGKDSVRLWSVGENDCKDLFDIFCSYFNVFLFSISFPKIMLRCGNQFFFCRADFCSYPQLGCPRKLYVAGKWVITQYTQFRSGLYIPYLQTIYWLPGTSKHSLKDNFYFSAKIHQNPLASKFGSNLIHQSETLREYSGCFCTATAVVEEPCEV